MHLPVYVLCSVCGYLLMMCRFPSAVFFGNGFSSWSLGLLVGSVLWSFFGGFMCFLERHFPVGSFGFVSMGPFWRFACFWGARKGAMGF